MKQSEEVLNRLKSIEGHVHGIERMAEDGEYCIDILRQIQAVQAALDKVGTMILSNHLNTCVTTAIRGDDPDERERVLSEVVEVFDAATKI